MAPKRRTDAEGFMRLALAEAARGEGRTHPNPTVGAVIVRGGRVVARGFHRKAGAPHGEAAALEAAGALARGADLYVTLEPCDHFGRTPPCSRAILEAGVRRIFVASADPNPQVRGRGLARLRRAGVEVVTGVLTAEADRLNRPYFKLVTQGLPFVTLKVAVTWDGKLATGNGDSRWVSGEASRARVHGLRNRVDAIVVGANTVRRDDPLLTTRLPKGKGRDAARVVLDSGLALPRSVALLQGTSKARTLWIGTEDAPRARALRLEKAGAEVWLMPRDRRGGIALLPLLRRLAGQSLLSILVEGGAQVHASFLREGLADELLLFMAPKLVGAQGMSWLGRMGVRTMAQAWRVHGWHSERLGEDLLLTGEL